MRTFDDIIPPSRRTAPPAPGGPLGPALRAPRPRRFPYLLAVVAVLVVGGCAFALNYFSRASIQITPAVASETVAATSFTAGTEGDLPFILVMNTTTATDSVASSGMEQSSAAASGSITIYNAQPKTQKLISNTRFTTPAGLIFRIHSAVTIPAGNATNPGSVVVIAYADQPGPTYDIGPSSFSIPGLAGTSQATAVYAHSTNPMSGGSVGQIPVVTAADESAARTSLEQSLSQGASAALPGKVPVGYILLPGATTTTYEELPPAPSASAGQADIAVAETVSGVAFPSAALASAIATANTNSGTSSMGTVALGSGSSLSLTPQGPFPTSISDSFTFSLSGSATLVSTVDPSQIATAVAGKSRTEAQVVLTNYPEIKQAVLLLRPFWRQTFPQDPSAITVTVVSPTTP